MSPISPKSICLVLANESCHIFLGNLGQKMKITKTKCRCTERGWCRTRTSRWPLRLLPRPQPPVTENRNPKALRHQIRKTQPKTQNPKPKPQSPETRNTKHGKRNPKTQTPNPQPELQTPTGAQQVQRPNMIAGTQHETRDTELGNPEQKSELQTAQNRCSGQTWWRAWRSTCTCSALLAGFSASLGPRPSNSSRARNTKPETRNPRPETEPETRNPKVSISNSKQSVDDFLYINIRKNIHPYIYM
jgi:hypothetical protein